MSHVGLVLEVVMRATRTRRGGRPQRAKQIKNTLRGCGRGYCTPTTASRTSGPEGAWERAVGVVVACYQTMSTWGAAACALNDGQERIGVVMAAYCQAMSGCAAMSRARIEGQERIVVLVVMLVGGRGVPC